MATSVSGRRDLFKVMRWFLYSIAVPLFPMLLALLVLVFQGRSVAYESLLGGTEIFILSVTVLAATRNEMDNSSVDFSQSPTIRAASILLFPFTIFMSMVFGAVYLDQQVQDNSFIQTVVANAGILLGFITTGICVTVQTQLTSSDVSAKGSK